MGKGVFKISFVYQLTDNHEFSTVAPRDDVKVEDTWNFFIVLTVRGGQGE